MHSDKIITHLHNINTINLGATQQF